MPERRKIGFLGPAGTWAEEALHANVQLAAGETRPYPSVYDVIAAVSRGEVDEGIVPIENSLEGSVSATLDMLAFDVENILSAGR